MHDTSKLYVLYINSVTCTRARVCVWRGSDLCDAGCVNFYSHFLVVRLRNRRAAQYWFSGLVVVVTAFLLKPVELHDYFVKNFIYIRE